MQNCCSRLRDAAHECHCYLRQVAQTQVGILQQHPLPFHCGSCHVLTGNDLLTLSHTYTKCLDLLLLGKVLQANAVCISIG